MGNSRVTLSVADMVPVHPHVHGELVFAVVAILLVIGSSPRAWGTHNEHKSEMMLVRFIPTCMGNSWVVGFAPRFMTVHPHVHGELFPA